MIWYFTHFLIDLYLPDMNPLLVVCVRSIFSIVRLDFSLSDGYDK